MRQVIRSVEPFSLAKVLGVVYAGLGLVVGALFSVVALLGFAASLGSDESGGAAIGMLFGVGAVVVAPILYGILGFIAGLIAGFLFNLASRLGGGLVIELE